MDINPADYSKVTKYMRPGENRKVQHVNCSDSRALSITCTEDALMFKCFKCDTGWIQPHEDQSHAAKKRRAAEAEAYRAEMLKHGYGLPDDCTTQLQLEALAWLGKGGWTNALIERHRPLWSGLLGRVVFRVEPAGYIARAVSEGQQPKYLSKTPRGGPAWWSSEPIGQRCCITEDILSAGRVGEHYPAMAALGTDSWNWEILARCRQILIWTDNDGGGEKARRKIRETAQWLPVELIDIRTEHDPKAYSWQAIKDILTKEGADV